MQVYSNCSDTSCPHRTALGYCKLTACNKSTSTTYTNNSELVEISPLLKITDEGMKNYIKIYLRDHTLEDLVKLIASIMNGEE